MAKPKLIKEMVFSTIEDKRIRNDVKNSPIWKSCLHWEDVTEEQKKKGGYVYTIYFEGVTPISVTSVRKL